jgi:hypothetical protein
MPNYQESAVAGTSWTRACRVICENPLSGQGLSAGFVEERVVSMGADQQMTQPMGVLTEPFSAANMGEVFNLLDPATGAVIGTSTYGAVFMQLHSLYYHVAAKRDAAPAAVVPE